jgi:putative addiction module component (TIGR02574 family)
MSTAERLQTMEAIWDSLLYENEDTESPEWHNKIIEKRIAKIKGGKAKFISLSDLKASRKL